MPREDDDGRAAGSGPAGEGPIDGPLGMGKRHDRSFVQRYLDPSERLDELLFGLIMVLSITLGVSLATDAGGSASQVAWAIVGCNLAWGLIDGCMHVVTQLFVRGSRARLVQALRSAGSEAEQLATVGSVLDDQLCALTTADERRGLYLEISRRLRGAALQPTRVAREDVYGGLAIVWLVVLASVPAVVPFLFIGDRFVAARVSNALVLATLFGVGCWVARAIHANPWALGLSTTAFGLVMVTIVVMLGG